MIEGNQVGVVVGEEAEREWYGREEYRQEGNNDEFIEETRNRLMSLILTLHTKGREARRKEEEEEDARDRDVEDTIAAKSVRGKPRHGSQHSLLGSNPPSSRTQPTGSNKNISMSL